MTTDTKFGTANACKFFVCPSDHVHVVGYDADGQAEYEIVLGKPLMQRCMVAIRAVQMGTVNKVTEIE